jgi:peptidoglycan/xylan/chitin deacetylase (PgdA/CDA1 family)
MFGRGKREFLAQLLKRSGILRLLESAQLSNSLLVLNYHRILNPADCEYDRGVISATPDEFHEQVAYFRSRFQVMGLAELSELVESGKRARGFRLMITFDDGYIDNYQYAFPILRSAGLTASFFLPTSYIGSACIPWWDQIANLLRRARNRTGEAAGELEDSIRRVLRIYKSPAVQDTEQFVRNLESECGVKRLERASPPLFMNWDQAREMAAGGMSIGSHTHSHRILSKLTADEQTEELRTSRQVLERELKCPVRSLAIPVGARDAFNSDTERALAATQYQVAFSFYDGVNRMDNLHRFDIKRTGVERDMSLARVRFKAALAASTGRSW